MSLIRPSVLSKRQENRTQSWLTSVATLLQAIALAKTSHGTSRWKWSSGNKRRYTQSTHLRNLGLFLLINFLNIHPLCLYIHICLVTCQLLLIVYTARARLQIFWLTCNIWYNFCLFTFDCWKQRCNQNNIKSVLCAPPTSPPHFFRSSANFELMKPTCWLPPVLWRKEWIFQSVTWWYALICPQSTGPMYSLKAELEHLSPTTSCWLTVRGLKPLRKILRLTRL